MRNEAELRTQKGKRKELLESIHEHHIISLKSLRAPLSSRSTSALLPPFKMDITLQTPDPPVHMLSGYTSDREASFMVHCHDTFFRRVTMTSEGAAGKTFRVDGSVLGSSWSWRRKVLDGETGAHVFSVRHRSFDLLKNGWVVESPDGKRLCSLAHKTQITSEHSAIDGTVRTVEGEEVLVTMRHEDSGARLTRVSVGDVTFASIRKYEDNYMVPRGGRARSVWEVRVAAGVDLSLVMVMVFCRAEMSHVWRQ
ncbi:hypothetical protein F4778DRAFT_732413 [Xylariomycetidae sp. FL2044]|nr:hypothetical protein F4778DRAFT_732413 [Xylariomycetidae sp. FL2044]